MKRVLLSVILLFAVSCPMWSQDVVEMMRLAETHLEENRPEEAAGIFERIVEIDHQNYEALAFLCNYQFALGMKSLQELESAYYQFKSPTRMQTAKFENALKALYDTRIKKAENYLIKAYLIRRNDYLDVIAGKIADFKERIGIKVQKTKPRSILERLVS